jgi:hypothetical protein
MPDHSLTGITPHRTVSVRWDIAQDLLVEPATILGRDSGSIFPSALSNVERLKSGVFVLAPENDLSILHESATAHQYILKLEDHWTYSPICVEVPRQRALSELSGVAVGGDVASTGDWYITKRIAAGTSWSQPLSPVEAGPAFATSNYPLDPLAMAPKTGIFESNQGFLVRLIVTGAAHGNADVIFSFRFGGEITAQGYGKFELLIRGDGTLTLFEKRAGAWVEVASWPCSDAHRLSGGSLTLRIIPHWPEWIEFKTFAGTGLDSGLRSISDASMRDQMTTGARDVVSGNYAVKVDRPAAISEIGGTKSIRPITGEGGILVSVRRDSLLHFQISRIAYKASGTLTDRAFVIPVGVAAAHIARIKMKGFETTGLTSIVGSLETAGGGALTPANENFVLNGTSYSYTGWVTPGGLNKMRALVTLTNSQTAGSRWQTPSFTGYDIIRQAEIRNFAPGEKTGGNLRGLSITGPGYQPDHESCALDISDPTDALAAVRVRKTPVLVETTFDAADQSKKAALFRGQTGRITASLQGKHDEVYPRESWRRLDCDLVGMWDRLATNRFLHQQLNLSDESSHPLLKDGNARLAWRVSDAIWYLTYIAGFPASQISVPVDDIRFFATKTDSSEDSLILQPGTYTPHLITHWAAFYLNAFYIFDAGAGSAGMWRLLRPPTGSETPIWSFTLEECPAGKLAHLSKSYGANISPVLHVDGSRYLKYTVPPEGNVVSVIGRTLPIAGGGGKTLYQQQINYKSWASPEFPGLADPTSPDWLGYISPVPVVDPSLPTQEAVNFVCRRKYELSAHGRVYHQFAAELVLVNVDATDPLYTTRTHRPLRVGDVVNMVDMDGVPTKCVVHSANFSIDSSTKSANQLAFYELEEFRPDFTVGGWR